MLAYGMCRGTASQPEPRQRQAAAKTSTADSRSRDPIRTAPTSLRMRLGRSIAWSTIAPPAMDTTASRDQKVNDFLSQLENTIQSSAENASEMPGNSIWSLPTNKKPGPKVITSSSAMTF